MGGMRRASNARKHRTICDDGDATVVDVGPRGEHVSDTTLVFNRDVQTLWSAPDV